MQQGSLQRVGSTRERLQVWRTQTVWERLRGLLARPPLQRGQGLLLVKCNSVHTFGMRYPLDIAYLDKGNCIIKLSAGVKPRRFSIALGATKVLEMPAGEIARMRLALGEQLVWGDAG